MMQVKSESEILVSMLSETLDVVRGIRAALAEIAPSASGNSAMVPCEKVAEILHWHGSASSKLCRLEALVAQYQ